MKSFLIQENSSQSLFTVMLYLSSVIVRVSVVLKGTVGDSDWVQTIY